VSGSRLLARLRAGLEAEADPARALGAQAYMKSTMPYHGVRMPRVRAIAANTFAGAQLDGCDEWRREVLAIWRGAKFREERYAALMLAADPRFRECRNQESLPMFEEMIVTGAWWDYVDEVAHMIGEMLREHPREMRRVMRRWSTDANMWKRRVSIICQNSFKEETDLRLLYANIEPNLSERDFFIRKAIGWSLRAYAWTDPAEVARYVRENASRLSGLSTREALKNVPARLR
jgi:3-methyladenine DNA glycosylase AlkD